MDAIANDGITTEVSFEDGPTAVVRVVGEIDISTVGAVRAAMVTALEGSPGRLVFDLAGVDFMDSSGLAVLLQARKAAESIHVRNPSTVVRRLIELTGLSDVLPIEH
jgi:anti-sigma B factor antagonist